MNNFRELFDTRKLDFHRKVKKEMLDQLNELSGNLTRFGWQYEDGYFYCNAKEKDVLFILKSDFEPYLFDSLAVLPAVGHPMEYEMSGVQQVVESLQDLIDQEVEG
jgi:hypothetical protein